MSMQVDCTVPPSGALTPEAARPYLTAEFGHFCFRCELQPNDERPRMDVDHIIPVARGGGNSYLNYQYLCGPCNSWKRTQIIDFRPGERRRIDAGLPIIPNEDRVRKMATKPISLPVAVVYPALTDDPAWRTMAPAVAELMGATLKSGDAEMLSSTKAVVASALTVETNAAIARNPTVAAQSLLKSFIIAIHMAMDHSLEVRELVRIADEALQGWRETTSFSADLTQEREGKPSLYKELIHVYRQRNRRELVIALLVAYALLVTGALLWRLLH